MLKRLEDSSPPGRHPDIVQNNWGAYLVSGGGSSVDTFQQLDKERGCQAIILYIEQHITINPVIGSFWVYKTTVEFFWGIVNHITQTIYCVICTFVCSKSQLCWEQKSLIQFMGSIYDNHTTTYSDLRASSEYLRGMGGLPLSRFLVRLVQF